MTVAIRIIDIKTVSAPQLQGSVSHDGSRIVVAKSGMFTLAKMSTIFFFAYLRQSEFSYVLTVKCNHCRNPDIYRHRSIVACRSDFASRMTLHVAILLICVQQEKISLRPTAKAVGMV